MVTKRSRLILLAWVVPLSLLGCESVPDLTFSSGPPPIATGGGNDGGGPSGSPAGSSSGGPSGGPSGGGRSSGADATPPLQCGCPGSNCICCGSSQATAYACIGCSPGECSKCSSVGCGVGFYCCNGHPLPTCHILPIDAGTDGGTDGGVGLACP
jgi:hypothetical protein